VESVRTSNPGLDSVAVSPGLAFKDNRGSCPVEVIKLNPSHESFWNNLHTYNKYGVVLHNKFLEVKMHNNTNKAIRGVKFAGGYYDSTEDLHTIPVAWGWHSHVNPGETKTGNWENNLWQEEATIGWVVVPIKILFEDGTKVTPDVNSCVAEFWKDKKHPRVNRAPDLDGVSLGPD